MNLIIKGVIETPIQPIKGSTVISSSDPVITHYKDSENQGYRKYHPCVYCPDWTRCVGFNQWNICRHLILKADDGNK